jgi:protoporphyrinogen oxidase
LAYVVYTKGFEDDLALVVDWATSLGIFLHGRFGSHNYLNVDGCLEQSIGLARQLGNGWTDEDVVKRFTQIGEI